MLKLSGAWLCGLSSVPQGSGLARVLVLYDGLRSSDAPPGVSSLGSATQHDKGGRRPRLSNSTAVADDSAATGTTTSIASMSESLSPSGRGANNEVDNKKTSMGDEFESMSLSGRTYTHPMPYRLESSS